MWEVMMCRTPHHAIDIKVGLVNATALSLNLDY